MLEILSILETLGVMLLTLFVGAMSGQENPEERSFKLIEKELWYPVIMLLLAIYTTVLFNGMPEERLVIGSVAIAIHLVLHLMMVIALSSLVDKFRKIQSSFATKYLIARSLLSFSIVFEVFAIITFVVCWVKIF